MSTKRKIPTKRFAARLFPIILLIFACPSLAETDTPSVKEIEREIEQDLKKYFSNHPEEAEAFFNKDKSPSRVGDVYYGPAHQVIPCYGPAYRMIPYIYKYGDRGWKAAIRVYQKMRKARDSAVCFSGNDP
jgi:hypothetical protein